jgi:hypothetical protein
MLLYRQAGLLHVSPLDVFGHETALLSYCTTESAWYRISAVPLGTAFFSSSFSSLVGTLFSLFWQNVPVP